MKTRRAWFAAVFAAVALLGLGGCSSKEQRRAEYLERAEAFAAEGKTKEALIELRNALKLAPQDADLNYRIGELFESSGQLADALFFYQEANRLAPEDSRGALATAHLSLFDNPDRAEELIEGVIAREPQNAVAYIRRSELALVRANTKDALAAALTAQEMEPRSHMAHFQVGVVQRARVRERELLGQPVDPQLLEQALAAFDRGLAVAPKDAPVHEVVRGWTERALVLASWPGRESEVQPAFEKAADAARERGNLAEERKALGEARTYARSTRNEALERWALERQVATDPQALGAWARIIALSDDDATLDRLLAALPDDPEAHALYATTLSARGRSDEALAHLREQETRVANPVPLRRAIAKLHLDAGRFDEARAIEQQLKAEHPDRPETAEVASLIAMREGRFADAAAATRQLIERQETPIAQLRLAEALYRLGEFGPALTAANRALELAGDGEQSLQILRLKGLIEAASGDEEAATRTFGRLHQATGGGLLPEDIATVARALYATGRVGKAREVLAAAFAAPDPPIDAIVLYVEQEFERDPQNARAVLARAIEKNPHRPALVYYQARFALIDGEKDRAEQLVADAIASGPADEPLSRLLRLQAQVFVANGKPEPALAAAERAMALNPELPGVPELVVNLLGSLGRRQDAIDRLEQLASRGSLSVSNRVLLARLHILAGNQPRAIELLESAIADRSDLPGARNDLAFLLAEQGKDLGRALELAQAARSALPGSAQVADTLGYVYLKRGLPEAAVEQLRAAIDLAPPNSGEWATSQYHLGLAFKALGREQEAREAFERALASAAEFPEAEETRREIETLVQAPGGAS